MEATRRTPRVRSFPAAPEPNAARARGFPTALESRCSRCGAGRKRGAHHPHPAPSRSGSRGERGKEKKKGGGGKKTTKPVPSGGSCGRRRTPGGAAGNRSAPQHSRPPPAELSTALARAPPPGYIGAPAAPPLARPRRQSLPGLTAPPAL